MAMAKMLEGNGGQLDLEDACVRLFCGIDLGEAPEKLQETLQSQTRWRQEHIQLWGKRYRQPRLIAWYGDPDASYRYSGITLSPLPWTPTLARLRIIVERHAGSQFNSVLLNYYRDHRDSMGLHADDEPELGPRPVIASLSLGEERKLLFKRRQRGDHKPVRIPLPSASLLVMAGDTQKYWKHGIEKLRRPCGPRINLTFRYILPPPG